MGIEVVARPRIGHEHAILGLAVAGAHPARLAGAASFSPNDTGRLHFPPASLFLPQGPSCPPAPSSSPTSSPTAPAPAIRLPSCTTRQVSPPTPCRRAPAGRSEEPPSELQSLMGHTY